MKVIRYLFGGIFLFISYIWIALAFGFFYISAFFKGIADKIFPKEVKFSKNMKKPN